MLLKSPECCYVCMFCFPMFLCYFQYEFHVATPSQMKRPDSYNVSRGIHRHQIQLLVWCLNQNRQDAAAYACFVSQWFSVLFSIRIVCCQLLLSAETYPNPRSPDTVDIRLWEIGVCMPRRIFVTECCEVVVFCALFIIIYITIILLCVEVFFWQLCASSALSWRECSLGWLLPVGRFGFKSRISSGQLVILFQNLHKQRYLLIYFQSSHT